MHSTFPNHRSSLLSHYLSTLDPISSPLTPHPFVSFIMVEREIAVITGGHGFIGSHVARRMYQQHARYIRIVDINPYSPLPDEICDEFIRGNLCDIQVCRKALRGAHTVLHFAANMGGMGTIHDANDPTIYDDNHAMTMNLLLVSLEMGIKHFFYASSACVYPSKLQDNTNPSADISLREDIVYSLPEAPSPQGLYGLQKLHVEEILSQPLCHNHFKISIARFHNAYGPGGTWNGGREKAPAAMLRKAFAIKYLRDLSSDAKFEIWGDGSQRRSFLFIDDAVDGVIALLGSDYSLPINIGSEESVSINDLAVMSLEAAGINPESVGFCRDTSKPVGVMARNSNNDLVSSVLKWTPKVSLHSGLQRTGVWIEKQICEIASNCEESCLRDLLHSFTRSDLVDLDSQIITFAILLPITSRGSKNQEDCLFNLRRFAKSLVDTTWRDTHLSGSLRFRYIIYLAIDHDDIFLLADPDAMKRNRAEQVLWEEGIIDVVSLIEHHPPGHVCSLWRDCARKAWEDKCDFMVLMGDDVKLLDVGWMNASYHEFQKLAQDEGVPFGFGCIAFTDVSFPGMPTFPIIHRTHLDIFDGEVVPDIFVNQDGDPYLFQLYRRWGCSTMFPSTLSNTIGGEDDARYTKEHARDWTFQTLDNGIQKVASWLITQGVHLPPKLTLDIAIPSYRVNLSLLDAILSLRPSPTCVVMFIVIIDDPSSPCINELLCRYGARPDIRIRVNKANLGASASRNRAMDESSADWIHFLDDDIVPSSNLLIEAEKVIRKHPDAAGFVGNATFPLADSVFTTAVHLAGVTYFWDIAAKHQDDTDVPWGVIANLLARRNVNDGVKYDLAYPKTGGGEDIDFCRRKRDFSIARNGEGFVAAPEVKVEHPWWNGVQSAS
ncbi:hypothetical protein ABKN59_011737 [Abortiporus biennis]